VQLLSGICRFRQQQRPTLGTSGFLPNFRFVFLPVLSRRARVVLQTAEFFDYWRDGSGVSKRVNKGIFQAHRASKKHLGEKNTKTENYLELNVFHFNLKIKVISLQR
jgi:hypothetical protein